MQRFSYLLRVEHEDESAYDTRPCVDLRFLKTVCCRCNLMSPEVLRMICDMHLRVLQFWKARSLQKQYAIDDHSVSRVDIRYYQLSAFGISDYDRYTMCSDIASNTVLGRVAGTERWGINHDP